MQASSIVGYSTTTSVKASGMKAFTVQFETTAGGELSISNLFTSSSPKTNAGFSKADQIWLWDETTSAWKYYYHSKKSSITGAVDGWVSRDLITEVTKDTVKAGQTFFFANNATTAQTLTLAGGVKAFSAKPEYTVGASKMVFVGYPWPQALPIAGFNQYCSNPKNNAGFTKADQIWRWDGEKSEWKYYYFSKKSSITGAVDGWVSRNLITEVTPDVIGIGEGFFFANNATVTQTIKFTNPAGAAD